MLLQTSLMEATPRCGYSKWYCQSWQGIVSDAHFSCSHNDVVQYHTINRAAFVCLFVCLSVCSLSPPRSFDGSSPNFVGVCRWTSELPLRGSFSKRSTARRVNGSLSLSTILYMHQPHATRCNGSSCLQLSQQQKSNSAPFARRLLHCISTVYI